MIKEVIMRFRRGRKLTPRPLMILLQKTEEVAEIIQVRDTWFDAVIVGDVGTLLSPVSDKVLIMHAKRSVYGKDALREVGSANQR